MIETTTLIYAAGFLGMLFGIPPCLRLLGREDEGRHYGVLLVIPGFAALMYLLMTLGIGEMAFQGYDVPITRYIDWLVTTPVLVGYAAYVAGMERGAVWGLAGADALMILFGTAALALSPPTQWMAFALSAFCHLALLVALYGPVRQAALDRLPARRRLARLLINHVGLLWIAYPIVWVFGPGLQVVSSVGIAVMITYMDVVAKVPYVYFVYRASETMAEEAASETATAPAGPEEAVALSP